MDMTSSSRVATTPPCAVFTWPFKPGVPRAKSVKRSTFPEWMGVGLGASGPVAGGGKRMYGGFGGGVSGCVLRRVRQ